MGAKWLYQLRSAPGQQTSTLHLFDRFEALGARRICKWKTQTSYHKKHQSSPVTSDKAAGDMFLVQFPSDAPEKCYFVVRQGEEDKVMEAGAAMLSIWGLMNSPTGNAAMPLYDQRLSMTVEGWAYEMGDFVIRVGSVLIRQLTQHKTEENRPQRADQFKGAVLEVEYLPSLDRSDSSQLIAEFVEIYCQVDGPTAVPVSGFRPISAVMPTRSVGNPQSLHWPQRTREYTNEHRAQQYVALFQQVTRSSEHSSSLSSSSAAAPSAPGASGSAPPAAG
eukprot:CAMPEP_0181292204 /NCGR_PEP_ID=MMETSP1101-20121128/2379_1 /TAXON_ID=46948 /ORGANISM="Rhodomonas abbreviata, Strain Caron Lab Isolate" /LENGTH=276 /DNA_ID=CAMNT_0023396653 /DNA_START=363 /DNA_END=1189 /DNA_ORIENTATION=+